MQNYIGLMSGTSLDGIDAAWIETDGEKVGKTGFAFTLPYRPGTREILRAALRAAPQTTENQRNGVIAEAETALTEAHAEAVKILLGWSGRKASEVTAIGFHGQTILHRPAEGRTWQIGDGARLSSATGIDVVADFRSADVAAGGEGAPLVPVFHEALVHSLDLPGPTAIVNIGGVGNVTWIPDILAGKSPAQAPLAPLAAQAPLAAFDTGPGNAPIDDWCRKMTGTGFDKDGTLAAAGRVDETRLAEMLRHPYFDRKPPKSLDRMDFVAEGANGLSAEDGAATLTAFTAASIACAARHFPAPARRWIICGGGRRNPTLMAKIARQVKAPVLKAEEMGWDGDALEAQAFGFLAARTRHHLPLTFPGTTGVSAPTYGGVVFKA